MGTPETPAPAPSPAPVTPPPRTFWSLRLPDARFRRRLLISVLIAMLILCFDISPVWRLLWRWHIYSFFNCATLKDAHGCKRQAWRWVEGRTIRVYAAPGVRDDQVAPIAEGARQLIRDVGLDFTVEVRPIPPAVLEAYNASTVTRGALSFVSFTELGRRLIELRDGDPHADILVINARIEETHWAFGMASFTPGLALARADMSCIHLGKHETGHLMGYMRHDSQPIFVFGYPWEGWPWRRDTLMMLRGYNLSLSPRARDALRSFWKGMESKTDQKFFLPAAAGE